MKDEAQMGSDLVLAARVLGVKAAPTCGEVYVDPESGWVDAANPCVLPAGHDTERHQDEHMLHWYPIVSRKPTTILDEPADAAEVARLRETLAAAQSTLAGIRSAIRCSGSVGLVEWATKIREDLDAAETTVIEGTEILSEARAALNCGLTAEQRNALTLCRLLGADCAACRLARRDIAVADLRVRLRGAEQQIDKRDADAAKIRAALGCRDGETTLAVAKRVPDLIRSLTADKAQLAADVVETRTQRDAEYTRRFTAERVRDAYRADFEREIDGNAALRREHGALDGETFPAFVARLRTERDAYHANARANGEQRDRFAADLGRLLRAVDAIGNLLTVHGSIAYVVAEAQRIRDGGAPVDPRDAEIARLTRERGDWRRCCDAARAERARGGGAQGRRSAGRLANVGARVGSAARAATGEGARGHVRRAAAAKRGDVSADVRYPLHNRSGETTRGQAERAALADGFDVLAHRAPSPVVAPPPSPLPDLAMLVPAEPRKGGAAKLTPARRRALEAAAKHHEGRWYPEGSGQCQMAREMAELGFGEYRHSGGGAGFTIGAKGRAVLRG